MKLIKPYFEIIEQEPGLEGIYKQIELAGRTCYKSTPLYRWYSKDKTRWINENSEEWKYLDNPKNDYPIKGENISAKAFTERMIKSGHWAMLEHGTVYLHIKDYFNSEASKTIAHYTGTGTIISTNFSVEKMQSNPYSKCNIMGLMLHGRQAYITTNYRTIIENNWLDDLKYLCEPTEYHEKRVCVRFICDRGVSHEYVRHKILCVA